MVIQWKSHISFILMKMYLSALSLFSPSMYTFIMVACFIFYSTFLFKVLGFIYKFLYTHTWNIYLYPFIHPFYNQIRINFHGKLSVIDLKNKKYVGSVTMLQKICFKHYNNMIWHKYTFNISKLSKPMAMFIGRP